MEDEAARCSVEFIDHAVITDAHPELRPPLQAVVGKRRQAGAQVIHLALRGLLDWGGQSVEGL
jgi:hypothetical protein